MYMHYHNGMVTVYMHFSSALVRLFHYHSCQYDEVTYTYNSRGRKEQDPIHACELCFHILYYYLSFP